VSARELAPDTVVDQRYSIISRIGAGGMAEVYCAEDLQLGRRVALKLLNPRFAADPDFVERFRREARNAAGLQHPNVVGIYDRGEWNGTYYIAMEYLEGRSLKEILAQGGPLEPARAIAIVIQVLRASRFAHQRGVIHRDIKPHNVIVDAEGRAKVTDFGIARKGVSDITETGSIMGTAQYLSPEQAQGHAVSAQSDLYSIGIMLYELLTGRVPFVGDSAVTIALKQVSEAPVPPSAYNPAVPQDLDAVVLRALEKDPEDRFADADEFIGALEQVRASLAAASGQSTASFKAVPSRRRGRTRATAVAPPPPPPPELTDEELAAEAMPPGPLPEPPPGEHAGRGWVVILGLVALAAAALLAFLLLRPEKVPLPNVVGTQLNDASAVLRNAGFDVEVERVVNPAPRDRVLREDPQPSPGMRVPKGSTVSLTVSDGPGQASVPDVSRLPKDNALKELEKAGFKVEFDDEPSEDIPRGTATRTAPPGGSLADKGSTVTLFISSGPGQVTVPDVIGQAEASAQGELGGAGLKVDVTEQDSDKPPGTVIAQDPAGGSSADKGSTVTIVVARQSAKIDVPGVTGSSQDDATETLTAAGLSVVVAEVPVASKDEDGVVQAQDPPAGRRVDRGTSVRISVGHFSGSSGGGSGGEQ
jgi:serine/threonine-protein kinase